MGRKISAHFGYLTVCNNLLYLEGDTCLQPISNKHCAGLFRVFQHFADGSFVEQVQSTAPQSVGVARPELVSEAFERPNMNPVLGGIIREIVVDVEPDVMKSRLWMGFGVIVNDLYFTVWAATSMNDDEPASHITGPLGELKRTDSGTVDKEVKANVRFPPSTSKDPSSSSSSSSSPSSSAASIAPLSTSRVQYIHAWVNHITKIISLPELTLLYRLIEDKLKKTF